MKQKPQLKNEELIAVDQSAVRKQKLADFCKDFYDPYVQTFSPTHHTTQVNEKDQSTVRLSGRVRAKRLMGKALFLDLEDAHGKIQLYAAQDKSNSSNTTAYHQLKQLDLGDIIGVSGNCTLTRRKQKTIVVHEVVLLAKCLHPIPVVKESRGTTYHKFSDHEIRYRKRFLDLMINSETRKEFTLRTKIIHSIRNFLIDNDFLEVETPMLQSLPGGAIANPFRTHHKALDIPLYLRIAPELYLKRLIVGGFPRVFEINRNFRNEGISLKHNPEFMMMELLATYADRKSMISLFEDILTEAVKCVSNTGKITFQGREINLQTPWRQLDYLQSITENTNITIDLKSQDIQKLKKQIYKTQKLSPSSSKKLDTLQTFWNVVEYLFDEYVEAKLIDPVIIVNHPKAISPLAKQSLTNSELTDRFEPYVMGWELGNGFSELNDPIEQRERFVQQKQNHPQSIIDENFLQALEYGMPPTGGLGIGIDRLIMLLLDKNNIRDCILFPLLRPKSLS